MAKAILALFFFSSCFFVRALRCGFLVHRLGSFSLPLSLALDIQKFRWSDDRFTLAYFFVVIFLLYNKCQKKNIKTSHRHEKTAASCNQLPSMYIHTRHVVVFFPNARAVLLGIELGTCMLLMGVLSHVCFCVKSWW